MRTVYDGDTLLVRLEAGLVASVRLIGVDAPEIEHRDRRAEFMATEAAAFCRGLAAGKQVTLLPDGSGEDRDHYGRLLRYVVLADGRLLNAELIRQGYARVLARFPFTRREEFREHEAQARRRGLGLWSEGGWAELRWDEKQGREPLRLHPTSGRGWALQYGRHIKTLIPPERLQKELAALRRLIEETRGEELERRLVESGFERRDSESR